MEVQTIDKIRPVYRVRGICLHGHPNRVAAVDDTAAYAGGACPTMQIPVVEVETLMSGSPVPKGRQLLMSREIVLFVHNQRHSDQCNAIRANFSISSTSRNSWRIGSRTVLFLLGWKLPRISSSLASGLPKCNVDAEFLPGNSE